MIILKLYQKQKWREIEVKSKNERDRNRPVGRKKYREKNRGVIDK